MRALLLLFLFLAACGRPLTPAEKSFAIQIHGDTINADAIRFVRGAPIGSVTYRRQKRPRLACRERIFPEPTEELVTVAPAAIALHNKILFSKNYYLKDYLEDYPGRLYLFEAMLFSHEITHVWQWQNRTLTGYTPLRALRENATTDDPYLFDVTTKTRLLDYGYEQQASIVEEYVCCATLDPDAPRTQRLGTMLRSAFPLAQLNIPDEIAIPWKDARIEGICR